MNKGINFYAAGQLIKSLREREGMSQEEFAKELNVTKAAVSQWESGKGTKTEKLYEIARFFNITIDELVSGNLSNDEDSEYFAKNYDLSPYKFESINDDNIAELEEYLKKCKNVINRVQQLYPKYISNQLNKKQSNEFWNLMKNFEVDQNFISDYFSCFSTTRYFDEIIEELIMMGIYDNKEIDRYLMRIYSLKLKFVPASLIFSKYEHAIKLYFDIIPKYERDYYVSLLYSKEMDIERCRDAILAGANFIHTDAFWNGVRTNNVDAFIGNVCLDERKTKAFAILDKNYTAHSEEEVEEMSYVPLWKKLSETEYEMLIDKTKIEDYRQYFTTRETNPYEYYKYLVARDRNKLGLE